MLIATMDYAGTNKTPYMWSDFMDPVIGFGGGGVEEYTIRVA